jgi:hypothetical protein
VSSGDRYGLSWSLRSEETSEAEAGSWKEIQGMERSGSGEAKLGLDPGEAFVEAERNVDSVEIEGAFDGPPHLRHV